VNTQLKPVWFWLILAAGITLRFAVATLSYTENYDFQSYRIVTDILHDGQNVYANTVRYNYGPVWFNLLHVLDWLAGRNAAIFDALLVGLLSAVDAGIFIFLLKKFGRMAAIFFFLNPISIFITGHQNQFDNLAILLALWAVDLIGDDFETIDRRKFSGLLLLGISLATKHIFFLFPLWLAVKQRSWRDKLIVLTVPAAVFISSFAPYWPAGHDGILNNVFCYTSAHTHFFYNFFVPHGIQYCLSEESLWLAVLELLALVCRSKNALESILIYMAALVAFSPSTADQYLVIPIAFLAFRLNAFYFVYTLFALLHLCFNFHDGLYPMDGVFKRYDNFAIYTLCGAVAWHLWRRQLIWLALWFWTELKIQLRGEVQK
jgi:hypothetical protein